MSFDEGLLRDLTEESKDLHADALRGQQAKLSDVADHAADVAGDEIDPADAERLNASRRDLVDQLGLTRPGVLAGGAAATGIGALLASLLATPAAADKRLDVQILQT